MPNHQVTIRGGSMKIKIKKAKLLDEGADKDAHNYKHDKDGRITYVNITGGTPDPFDPLKIKINDPKNCEIVIDYEVP